MYLFSEEMKKSGVNNNNTSAEEHSDTFPSPGAPKGWSSERVPHPTSSSSRRHISAASLTPFYSGRALPSKWEDAERWICSPVSGYGLGLTNKNSLHSQFQRRPKSKSGPIVPPPPRMHNSIYSPSTGMQVLDGGRVKNFVASSPFSTGVLVADRISGNFYGQGFLLHNGSYAARSRTSNVPGSGWSDLASDDSSPSSQDEKLDDIADAEAVVSRVVSRRDMATQMSPGSSTNSSPRGKSSFSPAVRSVAELQNDHPAKLEVREVQIDKGSTAISWSKRHRSRRIKNGFPDVDEFYQNVTATCAPSLDLSEVAASISKLQREEAKITAWENLQRAKAEAAIRKLEMKLEKERSYSTDKILNKLKLAQMKAQEMRISISAKQGQQLPKTAHKAAFFHKHAPMSSFRSCFTCHHT